LDPPFFSSVPLYFALSFGCQGMSNRIVREQECPCSGRPLRRLKLLGIQGSGVWWKHFSWLQMFLARNHLRSAYGWPSLSKSSPTTGITVSKR